MCMSISRPSYLNKIAEYEDGELDVAGVLDLFSSLIKSGTIAHLQGSYGRTAVALIEAGYLTPDGDITDDGGAAVAHLDRD